MAIVTPGNGLAAKWLSTPSSQTRTWTELVGWLWHVWMPRYSPLSLTFGGFLKGLMTLVLTLAITSVPIRGKLLDDEVSKQTVGPSEWLHDLPGGV